ncbi:NUDIX hydrolase [Shewanella acanthi]|uniref:NUDIX hydrolase n=1 Tax=Shewanella acanthi TaxID=2864212 RepID=UPI001C658BC0|nr:NUDIX domain-containing protein [Shewanella acanthi]MCH1931201.1 NUDIX domain-containing protein [Shewanella shenzhenensis]QYJ77364.1 NUDIX domain-containing protein [Shewanella acanthi]
MRLLKSTQDPAVNLRTARVFYRRAARAIVLSGEDILLLYTQKYRDYSLPGGGIDDGESLEQGLIREVQEETGALFVEVLSPFGRYIEFRPWYRSGFNVVNMESFCYQCRIDTSLGDRGLGETRFEAHEIKNGMRPEWINIHRAIAHNEDIIQNHPQKGQSIERETFLLKRIVAELF